jgi:hypothetical protein
MNENKPNIDLETGIHYGAISQNEVLQAWADDSEPVYSDCRFCPDCGEIVTKTNDVNFDDYEDVTEENKEDEFFCTSCLTGCDEPDYPPQAAYYSYEKDGYAAFCNEHGIIVIEKSPYYTEARECSPCYPNAGDLSTPDKGALKTYCFGYDWFGNNEYPYPIYHVDNGELVQHPGCQFLT